MDGWMDGWKSDIWMKHYELVSALYWKQKTLHVKGKDSVFSSLWAAAESQTMSSEVSAPQSEQLHSLNTTTTHTLNIIYHEQSSVIPSSKPQLTAQTSPFPSKLLQLKHKVKPHKIKSRQETTPPCIRVKPAVANVHSQYNSTSLSPCKQVFQVNGWLTGD